MRVKSYISKILLSLAAIVATLSVAAQTPLAKQIELRSRTQTKRQTVSDIIAQTGYKVFFEGRSFNPLAIVDFGNEQLSLIEILDKLTQDAGLTYTIEESNIIIYQGSAKKEETTAELRNIAGTVNDADGLPLQGVTIEVMGLEGKSATTGEGGHFVIYGIPTGNRSLRIVSADGQTVWFREVKVSAGSDAEVVLNLADEPVSEETESVPEAQATSYFSQSEPQVSASGKEGKAHFAFMPVTPLSERGYLPQAAFKFNALYGATAMPNISVEFGLGRKWTFDATIAFNPFKLSREGINRIWFTQPELRYWPCQRFEKHFVGLHGIYGQYNIGQLNFLPPTFHEHIYKGYAVGAGVSYGYHLPIGGRWSMEFSVGLGYIYLDYDKFLCQGCDQFIGRKSNHYVGPTKAAVSFIWMIK